MSSCWASCSHHRAVLLLRMLLRLNVLDLDRFLKSAREIRFDFALLPERKRRKGKGQGNKTFGQRNEMMTGDNTRRSRSAKHQTSHGPRRHRPPSF